MFIKYLLSVYLHTDFCFHLLFLSAVTHFSLCVLLRAAAMTLRTVLLSLQALLAAAEPDDPQDAVVANQVGVLFFF